jgi:hypothetical protein
VPVNGSGQATFSISSLKAGSHAITANYSGSGVYLASSGNLSQTVNQAVLTVTATGANRVYDANTDATVTLSDNRVAGDNVTDSYTTVTFDTKNVGTGKTVSVSGITISGPDAGNYTLASTTASATANITAAALTVSATGVSRVYDGTTAATVTLSDNHLGSDTVTDSYTSASFDTKDVGIAKAVSVSGIAISGADAGNYNLLKTTATTTADITPVVTATTVSSSFNPAVYGQTVTFTATVSNTTSGSSLVPTGAVQFSIDGVAIGNAVTLDGAGHATITDSQLPVTGSPHSVMVSYINSDGDFSTSNGSLAGGQTVNKATPTITWSNPADITYGTALSATQLDATASVSGTFSYTPGSGTVLNAGSGQTLSATFTPTDAADYNSVTTSVTINVNKAALTVKASAANKIYDSTLAAGVTLSDNRLPGDNIIVSYSSAVFDTKDAGAGKTVTVSGISISGPAAGNYTLSNTTASTTADITPAPLTITAVSNTKTYDGTPGAAATPIVSGLQGTDTVTGLSETYDTKNAGTGKTLSVATYTVNDGDSGGDYAVTTVTNTGGVINQAPLTIAAQPNTKTYDSTTSAAAKPTVSGLQGSDTVTGLAEVYDTKNVGTDKTLSVSAYTVNDGDGGGNYAVTTVVNTNGIINQAPLAITAQPNTKTYDATPSAAALPTVIGLQGNDTVTGLAEVYDNKNAGTGKTLSVSAYTVNDGNGGGNYAVSSVTDTTGVINQAALTVTASGVNKVYDGTIAATVMLSDNRPPGDVFTDTYASASFADKNVGTGKAVSVSGINIGGTDAGNYTFNTTASATADITARALTISATGVNKVYDGSTGATVTLSDDRVGGDVFTDSYTTASFGDKNVGTGKAVSVSGISIGGTDAANYTFNTTASSTADITARALTVSAAGVNKTYDGTTAATVTLSDDRVSGDVVTDGYTTASFTDKKVGTGKTVSVSGIAISGTDAGNYTFNTTASTTANITALGITGSITAGNKVYDTTTGATILTRTLSGAISGDDILYTGGTASFADKNAGTGKVVTATGLTLSGADAGNYTVNATATATANITPAALTVSAAGINKVYDGTTAATVTLSDNRLGSDVVTDSYASAAFAQKQVGTWTVTVNGISIGGADAGNYALQDTTTTTTASITKKNLKVTATGVNKVYDGSTSATVNLTDDRVSGDVLSDSYTSASFGDKNVGAGKAVSVSGIAISGPDAANYSLLNTTASTTANITARPLTVTAGGINKVYDATVTASVTLTDNRVMGDVFTDSYSTATFGDKNVGSGKTVTVSGINISGTDAGNYTFNSSTTTTANITPRALTITAAPNTKTYDATTSAAATPTVSGLQGSDTVTGLSEAYDTRHAGTGKALSVAGYTVNDGNGGGNYAVTTLTNTAGAINKAPLTLTAVSNTKTYDSTTSASASPTISGLRGSDTVTGLSEAYDT